MNTTELRLNNWIVDEAEPGVFSSPLIVHALYNDVIQADVPDDLELEYPFVCMDILPKTLHPIEITKEIILKAGFEKVVGSDLYLFINSDLYFVFDTHNHKCFFKALKASEESSIRIKHVHHLQNLFFCLTGRELKINLLD